MPTSIDTMIDRVSAYRDKIESGVVADAHQELAGIFGAAEVELAKRRSLFRRFVTDSNGNIQRTVENVEEAGKILEQLHRDIDEWIVGPGRQWANGNVPLIYAAGKELARLNLDVRFVSPELLRETFRHVSVAEKAVLQVGFEDCYRIVGVVGDDVGEWFRRELTDAVIEGIPVVNKSGGDSLMARLIEAKGADGKPRIRPTVITSKTGRKIARSLRQRAEAIARVESAKIINRTHEVLAEEALGDEAVYRNANPRDSRTTDVCKYASRQKPMTLQAWDNSRFGRPPRLRPFHLCRSVLIGGRPEWFD